MQRLLSPMEAAEFLNVSRRTLEKWRYIGSGGPRFVKVGSRCAYEQSALEEWVAARRRVSTSDAA